jgi:hypothetical protein
MSLQNLYTVYQFVAAYPAFKVGGVRSLILNERENGLGASGALLRVGGKILIDSEKFFEWIQMRNNRAA